MKRNKKSMLNALAAILLTLSNGLLGLITTQKIIQVFGSDFNGLNSTANQLVTMLMLLEGGFTIATNVALFGPYSRKEYDKTNAIISATRLTFRKMGLIAFVAGILLSVGYSFVVNTNLAQGFVIIILLMTMLPVAFNLYLTTTYRIVLQADQKEYIISLITFFTLTSGYITNLVAMNLGCGMWFIRFSTMGFSIINSFAIVLYVKIKYSFLNVKANPDFEAITGTKDVFAQKITGVLYNTAPMTSMTISSGGTMLASVYGVYNSVFSLLKSLMFSIIDSPRLGMGELISQKKPDDVWPVFKEYQWVVFFIVFTLLSTAGVLIMPFVAIYSEGLTDVEYIQPLMAFALVLTVSFEMIHIPCGHVINMSGRFKIARNIQLLASALLMVGLVIGGMYGGVYGILFAVLATAILLAVLEIGYVHTRFFTRKIKEFIKLILPLIVTAVILVTLERAWIPVPKGYVEFFFIGAVIAIINMAIGIIISFIFNKECVISLLRRIQNIFKHNKTENS